MIDDQSPTDQPVSCHTHINHYWVFKYVQNMNVRTPVVKTLKGKFGRILNRYWKIGETAVESTAVDTCFQT